MIICFLLQIVQKNGSLTIFLNNYYHTFVKQYPLREVLLGNSPRAQSLNFRLRPGPNEDYR